MTRLALDEGGLGLADALEDVGAALLVAVRADTQVHLVLARVGAVRGRHTQNRVGGRLHHVRPVDRRNVTRRGAARRTHRKRRHSTARKSRQHFCFGKKKKETTTTHKESINQSIKKQRRKRKKTIPNDKKEKDEKRKKGRRKRSNQIGEAM